MSGLLSWNAVVILVAAMIIPASPTRILVAALVSASTDPLAVWVAHLRGAGVPSVVETLVLFMPNYACAAVAVLPSRVLQRIGQSLKQAQDMGSYHLDELLGRGGMGEVWRASHRLLARGAAIKLVRPELLGAATEQDAENMIRRFRREAQATAALNSPHTIRLFDFGVTDERTFYYVMELLSGRDLDSLVRASGPLPAERVIFLLRQVCHSLAEAHAQGLVHRDVTPRKHLRLPDGARLRLRQGARFRPGVVQRSALGRRFADHRRAQHHGHAGVHGARSHSRRRGRRARRHLRARLRRLLPAHRPTRVRGRYADEDVRPAPPDAPDSDRPTAANSPSRRPWKTLVLACLAKNPDDRPQTVDELLRLLERVPLRTPWTNDAARQWWDTHLVELAAPMPASSLDRPHTTLAVA